MERIKHNSKDWDLDEGKESGINLKFDCVKSFMGTNDFRDFSTKYGLDSETVASLCESFATHVDLPKDKWFKYHPPIEVKLVEPMKVEEETITYNVDHIVPTRIKEHAKASTMVRKSYTRTPTPPEQIKVEPSVSMVKDLLIDNIDGHVIYLCDEAARIAKPDSKYKLRPFIGMPGVSIKTRDHCYHGLCDVGASVTLYLIPRNYE